MTGWLLLASSVWALIMAVVIVQQRRSPAATIAWMLVLAFLPLVGYIIYRVIGPQRLERRKLRRRLTRKLVEEALGTLTEIRAESPMRHREQLAHIAISAGEGPPLRADALELYTEGLAAYADIVAALSTATHHIHVEYYIWEPDAIGARIRDLLVLRAKAGVEVRVILDGTGSYGVRGRFFKPLTEAGGEVHWFNPVSLLGLRRRRPDFRSHRKIIVCDGRVGFTGGMNLSNEHTSEFAGVAAWRDTHIRIEGSAVRSLQRVFVEDWMYSANVTLPFDDLYFPAPTTTGQELVQVVASGPDLSVFAIHKMYFAAINQATSRVWITTPYFVPDDAMAAALVSATMRGVDVRIMVPAKGDSKLVDMAARSYFPDLLDAGARIFEYTPRFIHAKTMVIDDDIAIVGTANLDNRSFRLDFEVAAVVYGHNLNARLANAFSADLESCMRVRRVAFERQPFFTRLGQSGARLLSPLL